MGEMNLTLLSLFPTTGLPFRGARSLLPTSPFSPFPTPTVHFSMRFAYWSLAAGLIGSAIAGPVSSYEAPLWEPPAPPQDSPMSPMQA